MQAPKTVSNINPITGQTLPLEDAGDAQEGPFDFRSPVQDGRSGEEGKPAPDELTAEEVERGRKCGKAILERAMLGPPVETAGTASGTGKLTKATISEWPCTEVLRRTALSPRHERLSSAGMTLSADNVVKTLGQMHRTCGQDARLTAAKHKFARACLLAVRRMLHSYQALTHLISIRLSNPSALQMQKPPVQAARR